MSKENGASKGAVIDGLRALLDFLEEHPHLQPNHYMWPITFWAETPEELAAAARDMKVVTKEASDLFFTLTRDFGGGVQFSVRIPRAQLCTRRQVGTRIVPAQPEHEEPVYEWDCPDSILDVEGPVFCSECGSSRGHLNCCSRSM